MRCWSLIAGVAPANQFPHVRDQSCPASITQTHTGGKSFITTAFGKVTRRERRITLVEKEKFGEEGEVSVFIFLSHKLIYLNESRP